MPTPKAHLIITAIVTRLKTIQVANGYVTEFLPARVADSESNWQASEGNAISVFEGRTSSVESSDSRRKTVHVMPVLIKIFLAKAVTPANMRTAIADVKKAIRKNGSANNDWLDERWPVVAGTAPGLAMNTAEVGHGIEYAENSFEIVAGQVELEVTYKTERFNSYE
jgi:hypothetical protein